MAIWLLFDEEDSNNKKGFSPITPVIEYPVQYEVPDSQKAQQNKAIGDQAYKADNFLQK
jgi:rubredoxin